MAPADLNRAARADLLPAETRTSEETMALGVKLAATLEPGDVVALYGELGSGKTHLVKGICLALGIPAEAVNSPTFAIVHEYGQTSVPVFHIDAYRIETLDAFYELGYEDFFYGEGFCFVEWPDRVETLLPEHTLCLRLTHLGGDRRRIAWEDEEKEDV